MDGHIDGHIDGHRGREGHRDGYGYDIEMVYRDGHTDMDMGTDDMR